MNMDTRKPNQARPKVGQELPHSRPAEESLISVFLRSDEAWDRTAGAGLIEERDYYHPPHQYIHRACKALADSGRPRDAALVIETLKSWKLLDATGLNYIATLATGGSAIAANAEEYAARIRENRVLRDAIETAGDIRNIAMNPGTRTAEELFAFMQARLDAGRGSVAFKQGKYTLLTVDDLATLPPMRWKVKGLLPAEGTAAIYGPAGSGKSFLALDLAGAINSGREWFGRRVARSPVVYVCLEGEGGLRNRVAAYRTAHGGDALDGVRFVLQPMSLLGGDPAALVKAIKGAGLENPVVIIDTLNRATPGADENSGKDMSLVNEATKAIQQELGGLVILVHHSGKDASKGMRGHTNLPAALDAVIAVRRDGESRKWSTSQAAGGKVKDGADDIEHEFTLQVHHLDEDEDGDAVTSCSVVPDGTGGTDAGTGKPGPLGKNALKSVEILQDLFDQRTGNLAESGRDASSAKVSLNDWGEAQSKLGMPKNRAYEGRREAIRKGYVRVAGGYASLVPPGTETVPDGTGTECQSSVPFGTAPPVGGGTGLVPGTGGTDAGAEEEF